VTVRGIVIGSVTATGTEKTKRGMLIIIGTGTVKGIMRMNGKGAGHLGLTASHVYHKRRNIVQDQRMLIMGRGGGLLPSN